MAEWTDLFLKIVNMSISASWLVLLVIALRFLLKKTPKWINVLLWGMVAFRLLCPFTLESALSLIPSAETIPPEIMTTAAPTINTGIEAVNSAVNPLISESFAPAPAASANPLQVWIPILSLIWFAGIAVMLMYSGISYDRLLRRVRSAVWLRENIYQSEAVTTPFILGIVRPKIYLPFAISEMDMYHVTAHERMHIKRKDHWWKPFGFLLLTIHWFNPLMWAAYILLCRDIELACDERAIKPMNPEQRANYSQALLNCSVQRSHIAACPLAFGEVGVKERIKNVLTYKKPAFWVILISLILCILVAACFLTDPEISEQLEWLQTVSANDIQYVEYRCYDAELDKQYRLYQGEELHELAEVLNAFDGEPAEPEDALSLIGGAYTLNIVQKNGRIHTVTNYGNAYLSIDNYFFEDTHYILNQTWDYFFAGNAYLPAQENTDLGVTMTIEEVSSTRATIILDQYETRKDDVLFGGNDYFLQKKTDDGWEDLSTLENPTFAESAYDLATIRRHKIDWEWLYGPLPAGHYRIGKSVHIWKNSSMRNYGTVYAEFILSTEDAPFLTLTARDVSPTSMTVVCSPDLNDIDAATDLTYWLESYNGTQWQILQPTQEIEPGLEVTDRTIHLIILHGNDLHKLNWSTLYGSLPPGTYRAGMEFFLEGTSTPIYAEFTIEDTGTYGIHMELSNVSPTGATVNFLLPVSELANGDLKGADCAFSEAYDLQRLENGTWYNGSWTGGTWVNVRELMPETDIQPPSALSTTFVHNWETRYGSLPDGHYRIRKTVTLTPKDGETIFLPFTAEFTIPATPSTSAEELPQG